MAERDSTICCECGRCHRCGRRPIPGAVCFCANQPKCARCGAWIRLGVVHECRLDRPFDLAAAFHDRVTKDNASGCWLWTGRLNWSGYGVCPTGKKGGRRAAHRVSYEIYNGPIGDGLFICHRCDNPRCVNPEHLFAGTQQQNIADCARKGRMNTPNRKGQCNGRAKLTAAQVLEIRDLYRDGRSSSGMNVSGRALARRYGVSRSAIYRILKNVRWVA